MWYLDRLRQPHQRESQTQVRLRPVRAQRPIQFRFHQGIEATGMSSVSKANDMVTGNEAASEIA